MNTMLLDYTELPRFKLHVESDDLALSTQSQAIGACLCVKFYTNLYFVTMCKNEMLVIHGTSLLSPPNYWPQVFSIARWPL